MTETEAEAQETPEEPTEAPEEPEEGTEGEEPTDEPAEEEGSAGGSSLDAQKAIQDEAYSSLGKRAKSYADSIGKVLSDVALPLSVCELCSDAYPGVRWTEPKTEAATLALEAFHGSFQLETLNDADWTDRCHS